MIIDIIQQYKELFEAKFLIVCDNTVIGEILVYGNLVAGPEGRIIVNFADMTIKMKYGKKNLPKGDKTYRPYDITIDDQPAGTVYQTDIKEGSWFSKYPVFRLYLNGEYYTDYSVCFKEGAKSPLYHGDTQIAETHKSSVIYNDMHNYRIYTKDKESGRLGVILCCYSYVLSFFNPGTKIIKGVRKINYVTTNESELAKYNPEFIKDC